MWLLEVHRCSYLLSTEVEREEPGFLLIAFNLTYSTASSLSYIVEVQALQGSTGPSRRPCKLRLC